MKIHQFFRRQITHPPAAFKILQRVIAIFCMGIPFILWIADTDTYYPAKTTLMTQQEMKQYLSDSNMKEILGLDSARRLCKACRLCKTDSSYTMGIYSQTGILKSDWQFRYSISHYAQSSNSYLFGMLYGIAAMLFISNGVLYMRNNYKEQKLLNIRNAGSWYHIAIGISLLGVVLNPVCDKNIFHVDDHDLAHIVFSAAFFLLNIIVIVFFPNDGERTLSKALRYSMALTALVFVLLPMIDSLHLFVLWGEWLSLAVIAVHLFLVAGHVKEINAAQEQPL